MSTHKPFLPWITLVLILLATFLPCTVKAQESGTPQVLVLTASGPLTPSMGEYLQRGLRAAEQRNAEALIFELNTPGGGVTQMTAMIEDIRASTVPVIVYVYPRGAMAGSAGTIITVAGHAAAMAPETTIGAASPVGSQGEDLGQTMAAKEQNIMKATVRSLMERRSEQAIALAESTIDSAQAVSANEALSVGLIDFIASSPEDLLKQLDGFQVETVAGTRVLHTSGATLQPLNMNFLEQLLDVLTNPNIVFLLLIIGAQAIIIEISSPGGWVAGFIGVLCLALSTYGLGILSPNWFGLILLGVAFVLFILDIKAPTHGALTIAGVGSLIAGALVLFNSPGTPSFQRVSVPLVIGSAVLTAAFFFAVLSYALRAMRLPVVTGRESLLGQHGVARSELAPRGIVHVDGEMWSAEVAGGEEPIPKGARVEVVGQQGLRLLVRQQK